MMKNGNEVVLLIMAFLLIMLSSSISFKLEKSLTLKSILDSYRDLSISSNIKATKSKISHLYLKFHTSDLTTLSNTYIRNTTRKVLNDLAGTYTVDSLLTNRPQYEKTAENLLSNVLAKDGIVINQKRLASSGIKAPFVKSFKASAMYCSLPL